MRKARVLQTLIFDENAPVLGQSTSVIILSQKVILSPLQDVTRYRQWVLVTINQDKRVRSPCWE